MLDCRRNEQRHPTTKETTMSNATETRLLKARDRASEAEDWREVDEIDAKLAELRDPATETRLTLAQRNVSLLWPTYSFHAVKVLNYRHSRVLFEAARKLGYRASWSGDLMILWRESEAEVDRVIEAGVERFLRASQRIDETERAKRRAFLRRWAPRALPAFELIVARAFV